MQLKKIVLYGFKSFADKTTIDFEEKDWLTAVVGPNGCGKSNIVDAVQWVLGEQSIKSMRAQERADVIFSGTGQRQPVNFAEVTLVFDDNEGILPLEYTSVAVTRRIYRNGESDYLINKHPVRLKDIHDLFLDTGLGPQGYAIFKQGKMDEVIQMSPKERRHIFLRAAGIERFMERKAEAHKKLQEADGNMARVMDIVKEVEQRIGQLEKQVSKALLFQQNREELFRLSKTVFLYRWKSLLEAQGTMQNEWEEKVAEKQEIEEKSADLHKHIEEKKYNITQLQEESQKEKDDLLSFQHRKEYAEKEKAREKERHQTLVRKKEKLHNERIEESHGRERREKEKTLLEEQWADVEDNWQKAEKKSHSLHAILQQEEMWEQAWQQQRKELVEQQKAFRIQTTTTEKELYQRSLHKENLLRQSQQGIEQLSALEERSATQRGEKEEKEKTIHTRKKKIDRLQEAIIAGEEKWKVYCQEEEAIQKEQHQKQQSLQEVLARDKALQRLREEKVGFSADTKKILAEAKKAECPFFDKVHPLHEAIRPKQGEEEAVASILRHYVQTLLIATQEDLKNILSFCQEKDLQEYSLFCQEKQTVTTKRGSRSFRKKVEKGKEADFFLHNIVITDTIEEAFDHLGEEEGKEVWISPGYYLDRKRVLHRHRLAESNVFLREAEIQSLQEKRDLLTQELTKISDHFSEKQREKRLLEKEKREQEEEIRKESLSQAEDTLLMRQYIEEERHIHEKRESLFGQHENAKRELSQLALELEEKEKAHIDLMKEQDTLNKKIEREELRAENRFEELHRLRAEKRHHEQYFQSLLEEKSLLREKRQAWEIEERQEKKRRERREEEIQEIEEQRDKSLLVLAQMEKEIHTAEEEVQKRTVALDQEREKEEWQQQSLEEWESESKKWREEQQEMAKKIHHIEILLAEKRASLEELEKERDEIFGDDFPPENEDDYSLDCNIEYAEKKVKRLRQEMTQVADVNMNAAKEYETQKERLSFLQKQMDDYAQSRQEFVEIIANLEEESRKRYEATFQEVREHFATNFSTLLHGGEANLVTMDEENLLESGVDIVARPPGKKQRSISLLSGGEKCLTAIALLLAIFRVKPSPFCLLDEMDAPLDETNVDRFLELLESYQEQSRFILITHNKRTMRKANRILGVSMEERGVSTILSMHLSQEKTTPVLVR